MPSFEFHHVHLYSPDPMKTAEFYEKFFGATRRRPDREVSEGSYALQLELNGTGIYIRSQREGATIPSDPVRGLEHFGLSTDDVQGTVEDLKANGFEIVIRNPNNPYIAFVRGPDNVLIELQQAPPIT